MPRMPRVCVKLAGAAQSILPKSLSEAGSRVALAPGVEKGASYQNQSCQIPNPESVGASGGGEETPGIEGPPLTKVEAPPAAGMPEP